MRHYLTYMKRVIKDPSRNSEQPSVDPMTMPDYPLYHVTDDVSLATRVQHDDVFWFVTIIQIGDLLLPPSIDARFVVDRKETRESAGRLYDEASPMRGKRCVFLPQESSQYLPWRACHETLAKLQFEKLNGRPGRPLVGPWKSWPQSLQRIRRLSADDAATMDAWGREVGQHPIFISYAWRDGAKLAARLAMLLSQNQYSSWIDHFCMPRRVSRGWATVANPKLESFLERAIGKAACFAAIRTNGWRRPGSWCVKELHWAQIHKTPGWDVEADFPGCLGLDDPIPQSDQDRLARFAGELASIARTSPEQAEPMSATSSADFAYADRRL